MAVIFPYKSMTDILNFFSGLALVWTSMKMTQHCIRPWLGATKQPNINWIITDQVLCRHMVSLSAKVLMDLILDSNWGRLIPTETRARALHNCFEKVRVISKGFCLTLMRNRSKYNAIAWIKLFKKQTNNNATHLLRIQWCFFFLLTTPFSHLIHILIFFISIFKYIFQIYYKRHNTTCQDRRIEGGV